jgi:Flp pilus assembly protein TadD
MRPNHRQVAQLLGKTATLAWLACAVAGCMATTVDPTTTATTARRTDADLRRDSGALAERYRANPRDPEIAVQYAQSLRLLGQRSQAAAVLENASLANPNDTNVLGAYGRALADVGQLKQALEVLERAHTPDQPNWRILSAQGAVLDQMGRHEDAQRYYASALKIVPNEPSVLSNLGLSYALGRDLPNAETTLRRAVANKSTDPRVRQNLALVVGLQGRFEEAEAIARADLPPEDAAANVAYLKQMLVRNDPKLGPSKGRAKTATASRS